MDTALLLALSTHLTKLSLLPQADKIEAILKAAGVTVEPYWPSLFAKVLAKRDMDDLITNVGAGAPVAAAGGAAAGDAAGESQSATRHTI